MAVMSGGPPAIPAIGIITPSGPEPDLKRSGRLLAGMASGTANVSLNIILWGSLRGKASALKDVTLSHVAMSRHCFDKSAKLNMRMLILSSIRHMKRAILGVFAKIIDPYTMTCYSCCHVA